MLLPDLARWRAIVAVMRIVALGDRDPVFFRHREIDATLALIPNEIDCSRVAIDSIVARDLDGVDGVWLLPGTPYRDDDAAYARSMQTC